MRLTPSIQSLPSTSLTLGVPMLIVPSLPRQLLTFSVHPARRTSTVILVMSGACFIRTLHVEDTGGRTVKCTLKRVKLAGIPAGSGSAPLTIPNTFMCSGQTVEVEIEGLAPGPYTFVATTEPGQGIPT